MKIGIDCWFGSYVQPRGIGKVTVELIKRLVSYDKNTQFYIFVPKNTQFTEDLRISRNCTIIVTSQNYFLHESVCIPYNVLKHNLDIIHSLGNTTPIWLPRHCLRVITIHDLLYLERSILSILKEKEFGALYRRINFYFFKKLQNLFIITPSHYSKSKISRYIDKSKINVIYNGVEINTNIVERNLDDDKFILTLGALDKRKNTALSIKSYLESDLLRNNVTLKVVGLQDIKIFCRKFGFNQCELRKSGIEMFEYVDDNQLHNLYRKCSAFLYISLGEGFGLPIIEAQLYGAQVIASESTSCAEVAAPSAMLVDPESISQVTNALNSSLSREANDQLADTVWLKRFQWQNIIHQYMDIYEKKN